MMKNKKRNFLLIWILALALLLNVLAFVPVVAEEGGNITTREDFQYNLTLKVNPGLDGEVELINDGQYDMANLTGKSFSYFLEFAIQDLSSDNPLFIGAGDYLEFDLDALENIINFGSLFPTSGQVSFKIGDTGSIEDAASYSFNGRKLKVTFDKPGNNNESSTLNDGTLTDRKGYVELFFDVVDTGTEIIEEIEVPYGQTQSKNFTVKRTYEGAVSISKEASYEEGSGTIVWTIDVNTVLENLPGAYIIDTLPEGLQLDKVEVVNLSVTTSGVTTDGNVSEITSGGDNGYIHDSGNRTLNVNLGDLTNEAKRVIITTTFAEGTGEHTYQNKVDLYAGTETEPIADATANITAGRKGISKAVQPVANSNKVNWTIEYVGDGSTTEITDVLTITTDNDADLNLIAIFLDKASMKVDGTTWDSNKITVTETSNGLSIKFEGLPSSNETHTITYITETFYKGIEEKTYSVANCAKYGTNGPAKASTDFSKESIITKTSNPVYQRIGSDNKLHTYIDWDITVNRNNETWQKVVIKEIIPDGFKFVEAKIGNTPLTYTDAVEGTVMINVTAPEATLTKAITVRVTTELINDNLTAGAGDVIAVNKASVQWQLGGSGEGSGIGTGEGSGNSTDPTIHGEEFESPIKKSALEHDLKKSPEGLELSVSPDQGIAKWKLDYKTYTNVVPSNFIIKDEIDGTGSPHTYDATSFNLAINKNAPVSLTADGSSQVVTTGNTTFNYTFTISEDNKSFSLAIDPNNSTWFNDKANHLELTYRTNVNFEDLSDTTGNNTNTVKNKASIYFGQDEKLTADASQSYPRYFSNNGRKAVTKSPDDRMFTWKVSLNYKSKTINGPIVDTLSAGHEYVEDSLKITPAKLKAGDWNSLEPAGDALTLGKDYTVSFSTLGGVPTMAINFIVKGDDNEQTTIPLTSPIIIEYETKAVGIAKYQYKNNIASNGSTYTATATRPDYNKFVDKKLTNARGGNKDSVLIGDVLHWEIVVNESLLHIKNFALTDIMSPGLVLIEETFKVYKGSVEENNDVTEDFTRTPLAEGKNGFELTKAGDDISIEDKYIIRYQTLLINIDDAKKISNEVKVDGNGITNVNQKNEYNVIQRSAAGGSAGQDDFSVTVIKKDNNGQKITKPATFELVILTVVNNQTYETVEEYQTLNGQFTLPLTKNVFSTYYIRETVPPEGYTFSSDAWDDVKYGYKITLDEGKQITLEVANDHVIEKTSIDIEKIWVGGKDRPEITVQIYRQDSPGDDPKIYGEPISLTEANDWKATLEDLDANDKNGVEYIYSVKEISAIDNYDTTYSEDTFTITNTYVIPKGDITVEKTWKNGPQLRPSVTLQLLRDEIVYGDPITLDGKEETAWTYTWQELNLTDGDGNEYEYTVVETEIPENYQAGYAGLIVTNTYVSPKTEITVNKKWVGGPNGKPPIEVQLYREGVAYGDPVTLNGRENSPWTYTWTELDKTDKFGDDYTYTVDEVRVPYPYGKSLPDRTAGDDPNTFEIVNTYNSPLTDMVGRKVWLGGPSEKPDVTLQLMQDGNAYGEAIVLKSGTYEYVWKNLPMADNNGNAYEYTVKELNVPADYTSKHEGMTVTNIYKDPVGETITANKVWKDLPSGWTEHLPTIWFKLYRSVEGKTAEAVPGLAMQKLPVGVTQVSWNGLEKYDPDGKLYVYSVQEVDENGKDYEPKYFEKTEKGLTVTNAFNKELVEDGEDFETEIDVTGRKVWKGVPKGQTVPTIWLRLYRHIEGGTPVAVPGRPIMELRPGVTQGTWKDLEKVDEDYNYYIYTVKEVDSKGNDYEPPHFRKTEEGLTVTNTHTAGAPVTGETLSVYTIMGAMLMALAALFLILTRRKRAKAK